MNVEWRDEKREDNITLFQNHSLNPLETATKRRLSAHAGWVVHP